MAKKPVRTKEKPPALTVPYGRLILPGLLLAVLLAYGNTVSNHLVYDDLLLIPNNPALHNPWAAQPIFAGTYWGEIRPGAAYRPFSSWTIALNYWMNETIGLPGADPAGYHILNILLHAAASALVYLLLARLRAPLRVSAVSAVLFALHPVHTEAVAAVIGRAELWAFLFGLLMLLLHHRRSRPWQPGACYALALLSKESALMFFPLAVVMDYLFPGDAPRWPRRHYAGYALAAAAWFGLWMTVHADAVMPPPFIDNPLVGVSLLQRICTVASIQLDYLRMLVYPVGLSSDYSYNQVPIVSTLWHPRVIGFMSVTAAALWLGWRVRGAHPAVLFGIAGYAVLFGVTSNLIQPIGTIMADRLAYAPSFGFCVAAAYGLWCAGRRLHKTALWIASGLIFMGCGWLTMDRNATWANERVFYETQVRTAPNSAKAHYNLGTVLAKAGDDAAAVKAYETALAIFPYYPEPLYNMGNALKRLNAPPERVLEAYRGAIAYDRGHREAHANLATYLLDLGRTEEARPVVDSLAALDPGFPALAPLRTRLAQAPSASQAALPPVLQQGILAYADGNHVQAIRMIKQALEEASALPPSLRKTALMILSNAYRATGDQVQADAYRRMAEDIR